MKWVGDLIRLESTTYSLWPRFSQMEPTDQLDAANRRLPESRVRRFAKRKSASRTFSIFLVNPSLFSASSIERVGSRWLWRRRFGAHRPTLRRIGCTLFPWRVCSAVVKENRTSTSFVKHSDTLAFSVMSALPVTTTWGEPSILRPTLAPSCQRRGARLDCRSDIRR